MARSECSLSARSIWSSQGFQRAPCSPACGSCREWDGMGRGVFQNLCFSVVRTCQNPKWKFAFESSVAPLRVFLAYLQPTPHHNMRIPVISGQKSEWLFSQARPRNWGGRCCTSVVDSFEIVRLHHGVFASRHRCGNIDTERRAKRNFSQPLLELIVWRHVTQFRFSLCSLAFFTKKSGVYYFRQRAALCATRVTLPEVTTISSDISEVAAESASQQPPSTRTCSCFVRACARALSFISLRHEIVAVLPDIFQR